jgi:hypothetical protein
MAAHKDYALHAGDVLELGHATRMRVRGHTVNLCVSRLLPDTRAQLLAHAQRVGAHVVDAWSSACTHMVVDRPVQGASVGVAGGRWSWAGLVLI